MMAQQKCTMAPTHGQRHRLSRSKESNSSEIDTDRTTWGSFGDGDDGGDGECRRYYHHGRDRRSSLWKTLLCMFPPALLTMCYMGYLCGSVEKSGRVGYGRANPAGATATVVSSIRHDLISSERAEHSEESAGERKREAKRGKATLATATGIAAAAAADESRHEVDLAARAENSLNKPENGNGAKGGHGLLPTMFDQTPDERSSDEAIRQMRDGRRADVPDWARPSHWELEKIVRDQFGEWRSLPSELDDRRRPSVGSEPFTSTRRAPQNAPHLRLSREIASSAQKAPYTANQKNAEATKKTGRRGQLGQESQQAETLNDESNTDNSGRCSAMKQGMPPLPEEDVRRCYNTILGDLDFGEPLRQVEVTTLGADKPASSSPRGIVTYMSTSLPDDVRQLRLSLDAISRAFLYKHPYPVAVIHEDFTPELMERLGNLVPVPVHFVKVAFKLPDWMEPLSRIYPMAVKHFTGHPSSKPLVGFHSEMRGLLPYVKRGSFGYFHMCRFFAGAGYMLPFFDNFDFYLRLDSDSRCRLELPDYFSALENAGADYAFDSTFLDYGDKVQGLWNFAETYMREKQISPTFWNISANMEEVHRFKALVKAKNRAPYPQCAQKPEGGEDVDFTNGAEIHAVQCRDRHFQAVPAFYTNFEVARIEMLRSSWYQEWFDSVDKTASIFYNRWGDAPIRFLGLAMHLPAEKILRVRGCQHD